MKGETLSAYHFQGKQVPVTPGAYYVRVLVEQPGLHIESVVVVRYKNFGLYQLAADLEKGETNYPVVVLKKNTFEKFYNEF